MKSINRSLSIRFKSVTILAFFNLSGCSILVGQVKPVEEKAAGTKIVEVSQISPQWKKLKSEQTAINSEDIPDAAWQSQTTAAVISINSACRQNVKDPDAEVTDLHSITENLLSQWRNLKIKNEQQITVSGFPALETTAIGFYLNQTRKFQTIAVKTPTCVYDLIYLSPVNTFEEELSVFQQFRDNLKLK